MELWNCRETEISSTSVVVQVGKLTVIKKKKTVSELVLFHSYAPLLEFVFLQQISQNLIHEYAK